MPVVFEAHCRDCERTMRKTTPTESKFVQTTGIRLRCAGCERTEWATKIDNLESL